MPTLSVLQLGSVPYPLGLKMQAELVAARKQQQIGDTLLLLEHAPVITLGRNAKPEHVLASRARLQARGVELFECDRGGDVTYHGPGQLVGYPIFDLFAFRPRLGAVEFLRKIEEILIRACGDFGIGCGRIRGRTGVWAGIQGTQESPVGWQGRKIAAIGIHISRGVTSHGWALNVSTDLRAFELIVPCGIQDGAVTSLEREIGRAPDMDEFSGAVVSHFGRIFDLAPVSVDTVDRLLGRSVGVPLQPPPLYPETERLA